MRRKFPRREHPGVTARRTTAYIELMAGKTIPELHENLPPLPVKRGPRTQQSKDEGEGPVLAAVGALLAAHPMVRLAVRQNSGAMPYQNASGKIIPVWFYRIIRKPDDDMTLTDYWGFLKDNRPFALECKRPSWKHPTTDREIRQWNFINMITKHGGMGSFVRSADEAMALLP